MKILILNYNTGNTRSVYFALERLGVNALISDDPEEIRLADKIILPGVGEASSAMDCLKKKGLDKLIPELRQPVLGICLGMQLLCRYSEEGDTACLGIIDADVKKFPYQEQIKVPQVGWNRCYGFRSPLFKNVEENSYLYFVHSYYAETGVATTATTQYALEYSSALQRDNFFGVQFHPEKSGATGERILKNFLDL